MNDTYVQGFMDKCASKGVAPEAIVKQSLDWSRVGNAGLKALKGFGRGAKSIPGDIKSIFTGDQLSSLANLSKGLGRPGRIGAMAAQIGIPSLGFGGLTAGGIIQGKRKQFERDHPFLAAMARFKEHFGGR